MPILMSGELYWVRHGDGPAFIAEYQHENKDRDGNPAGPAWWIAAMEAPDSENLKVVSHIERPGLYG